MFREACTKARGFTIPIVTSIRTVGGDCAAGIGTAIIVNSEGWIVTAAHVLKQIGEIIAAEARTRRIEAEIAAANSDPTLTAKERTRRLKAIGKPKKSDIDRWSVWLGVDEVALLPGFAIELVDLAVARLDKFAEKFNIIEYPVFKDPTKGYDPGVSLCRMGYPFVDVSPVWDGANNRFTFTNVPLPVFPSEGILSRMQRLMLLDEAGNALPPPPFNLSKIETSNPGILGQSGGPIFDKNGTIWGIQSSTTSYAFDLATPVQQYYHVGVGVHAETIIGFFESRNIKYHKSDY